MAQCTDYVDGPYTNFNTAGGAPAPDGDAIEIDTFEIWKSEAYLLDNVIEGETYKFSVYNGPGAGAWAHDFAIGPGDGANQISVADASGLDAGSTCEITFTASSSGNYLLVINEAANYGNVEAFDNGYPKIEWVVVLSVTDQAFNNFKFFTSNDVLTMKAASVMENIVVYNLNGQVVLNRVLSSTTESIDLSSQATGVYIAKVSIEVAEKSFKISK
jgi:hypothetical protein